MMPFDCVDNQIGGQICDSRIGDVYIIYITYTLYNLILKEN